MKLFMLWDMEGTSGLFERDQAWYWYEHVSAETEAAGKQLLMADINAAAQAALDAGVDELIVCDTHHGGGNIHLPDMLQDERITYLEKSRGMEDGAFRWLPGLNESVDGFLVMGHHAKAGTPNTFLPHTCMLKWADFSINGMSVGEMGIEACFAGHWSVPTIMAHGDSLACAEAEAQFPGIVTAAVKQPVDENTCTGLAPEAAHKLVAEKLKEAIANAKDIPPFTFSLPMTVTVRMRETADADAAAERPQVERVDEYTVQFQAATQADVTKPLDNNGLDMPLPRTD